MGNWKPIETIPAEYLDGREVLVKRVHDGRVVKEGMAVFAVPDPRAPQLQPFEADPLGRPPIFTAAEEFDHLSKAATTKKWLISDRMYSFATPTHWYDDGSADNG